jgi:cytochrome c556
MGVNSRLLAGGAAVLALAVLVLVAPRSALRADENPDEKEVKKGEDILVKDSADPDAMKKAGEEIMKAKVSLKAAMYAFKLRSAGGLGIGPKADAIKPDGIEAKLINLSKKELAKGAVGTEAPDLEKTAQVCEAMSYVTEAFAPKKKVGDKDPKDWAQFTMEMRTAAADLAKAAGKKDGKGITAAAKNLTAACNNCHGEFRD